MRELTGKSKKTAVTGRTPAMECGGLEAWNGEGCGGTERGRRGLFIGIKEEGDRGHKGRD